MDIISNGALVSTESFVIQDEVGFCTPVDESIKFWGESGGNSILCGGDSLPLGEANLKKIADARSDQKNNSRKQGIAFYDTDKFHIIELGLLLLAVLSIIEFILWWPEDDERDKHNVLHQPPHHDVQGKNGRLFAVG